MSASTTVHGCTFYSLSLSPWSHQRHVLYSSTDATTGQETFMQTGDSHCFIKEQLSMSIRPAEALEATDADWASAAQGTQVRNMPGLSQALHCLS